MTHTHTLTPRERVQAALRHETPDRTPVDFLATPEIWRRLQDYLALDASEVGTSDYFDPAWEAILRYFEIDCRLLSYDQFFSPAHLTNNVEWWDVRPRSTPNRMWRHKQPDGSLHDLWGRTVQNVQTATGAHEEQHHWPLSAAQSLAEVQAYPWPEPDMWDFAPIPGLIAQVDGDTEYHWRFRIGSVFETAWQLRGLEQLMMDLALDPQIPLYIMDRLTDILVENLTRVLDLVGERLDMVYFYDDVATQTSLMISQTMWEQYIKPRHAKIIAVAKRYHKPVMYHCDGAIYPLIPHLVEMGIDLLNPVQTDAKGMDPRGLKAEFGDRLSFHGGINIIHTLPTGTPDEVRAAVRYAIETLGANGGYIMASSHHIQSDTPLANVLAMYEVALR